MDSATSAAKAEKWERALLNLRKISLYRGLSSDEEDLMACALYKEGHHAESAVRYHRIVQAQPQSFSATYQLARCLHEMKQYSSAEKYFRSASKCTAHQENPLPTLAMQASLLTHHGVGHYLRPLWQIVS